MKFGPGWVGESEAPPQWMCFSSKQKSSNSVACGTDVSRPGASSDSGAKHVVACRSVPQKEETFENHARGAQHNELASLINGDSRLKSGSIKTLQKSLIHMDKTSPNGITGHNFSSQILIRPAMSKGQQSGAGVSATPQIHGVVSRSDTLSSCPAPSGSQIDSEQSRFWRSSSTLPSGEGAGIRSHPSPEVERSGKPSWQGLSMHNRQYSIPVPPDLNVRYQTPGSPSSSLRTGSPQQPDLALQL